MAKIIGNTTVTPMAVSDWKQNDATKSDYIKNKPDLNVYSNTLKSKATGTSEVVIDAVSPIEHEVKIRAYSNNIPLYPYDTDAELIAGCSYTITNDGVYEISGEGDGELGYALIKTITLSPGTYTFEMKGANESLYVFLIPGDNVENSAIHQFYDNTTYVYELLDETTVSLIFKWTVEKGTAYSWSIKPYLFEGDVSNTKVLVCDENNQNEKTYYTDEFDSVSVSSLSPVMVIKSEGLNIEVEYNQDINAVIKSVKSSLDDVKKSQNKFATKEYVNQKTGGLNFSVNKNGILTITTEEE